MGVKTVEIYKCDYCPMEYRSDFCSAPDGWLSIKPYRKDGLSSIGDTKIACPACADRLRNVPKMLPAPVVANSV